VYSFSSLFSSLASVEESKLPEPGVGERVAGAIGGPAWWIHLPVGTHWDRPAISFAASFSQVSNQFFARIELRFGWLVAIEIADQADSQRDIVQEITVDVTAVDLAPPPIADFDLAVAGRSAISDHEMISESVLHAADVAMVIIEHTRVALSGAAVVHDDEFPAITGHRCPADFFDHRTG
jgi:hypothetical protein